MKRIYLAAIFLLFWSKSFATYTIEQETTLVDLNGVSIAYTIAGNEEDPAVLMVMGLMASHKVWGEEIVNNLVESGYQVVLFDNRDTGRSEN